MDDNLTFVLNKFGEELKNSTDMNTVLLDKYCEQYPKYAGELVSYAVEYFINKDSDGIWKA